MSFTIAHPFGHVQEIVPGLLIVFASLEFVGGVAFQNFFLR